MWGKDWRKQTKWSRKSLVYTNMKKKSPICYCYPRNEISGILLSPLYFDVEFNFFNRQLLYIMWKISFFCWETGKKSLLKEEEGEKWPKTWIRHNEYFKASKMKKKKKWGEGSTVHWICNKISAKRADRLEKLKDWLPQAGQPVG